MKITAAVVPVRSAPFDIETLDLAAPLADEVLVRVVASGMCHTDLHARDGYFPNLPYPVVCGHEGAGTVEQVGAAVADLVPAQRLGPLDLGLLHGRPLIRLSPRDERFKGCLPCSALPGLQMASTLDL